MATPYCPPGLDCTSCPSLSISCPAGFFCGNASETAINPSWLQTELARINDVPRGTAFSPSQMWLERECLRGVSCANTTALPECAAGTYCPRGNAGPLPCSPLSICGARAFFQVNFIVPLLALLLTTVVVAISATLVLRQRRAAAACRALAAAGIVRALPVVSTVAADDDAAAGGDRRGGLDLALDGVCLAVGGTQLLHGVSARAPPGRFTALLGPSGSGKSLLLALLAGRAPGAITAGVVTANGHALADARAGGRVLPARAYAAALGGRVGFVPREDTLDRELTARELLTLSAATRLPRGTGARAIARAVDDVLAALGLGGVADVVVGGSASAPANISGGQLKRVSVGMELVARPAAVLLDEPTSGLDATAALDLVSALHAISRTGVTVVAVLHQPRVEVWRLVDHVLLMGRLGGGGGAPAATGASRLAGGGVVFEGHPGGVVPYLTRPQLGGYALPAGRAAMNPADFALDCCSGLVAPAAACVNPMLLSSSRLGSGSSGADEAAAGSLSPRSSAATQDGGGGTDALVAAWHAHRQQQQQQQEASSAGAAPADPPCVTSGLASLPPAPTFFSQLALQAQRGFVVRMRAVGMLALYGFLHLFLSAALSTGFSPVIQGDYQFSPVLPMELMPFLPPFLRPAAQKDLGGEGLQQMQFFVTVAAGVAAGVAASGLFSKAQAAARREMSAGLSVLAFGLGRMAADLLIIAWDAALFCALWMLLGASGYWYRWLAIFAGVGWAASGFGYIAGALLPPPSAAMVCTIVCLGFAVFSGIEPPLRAVRDYPIVNWMWYLSFGTHVATAVYITFSEFWQGIRDRRLGASKFGFSLDDFESSIGALFGLGVLFRGLALLALRKATTGAVLPGASIAAAAQWVVAALRGSVAGAGAPAA